GGARVGDRGCEVERSLDDPGLPALEWILEREPRVAPDEGGILVHSQPEGREEASPLEEGVEGEVHDRHRLARRDSTSGGVEVAVEREDFGPEIDLEVAERFRDVQGLALDVVAEGTVHRDAALGVGRVREDRGAAYP